MESKDSEESGGVMKDLCSLQLSREWWNPAGMTDINQPTSDSLATHSESTTTTTDKSEISAPSSQQLEENVNQELPHDETQNVSNLETPESAIYSMDSEPIREEEKPAGDLTHKALSSEEEVEDLPKPEEVEKSLKVKVEESMGEQEEEQVVEEKKGEVEGEEEEEKTKEERLDDGPSQLENSNANANNNKNNNSSLGRNRRVRQKNRYFQDFHCIDLTKSNRNSRVPPQSIANVTSSESGGLKIRITRNNSNEIRTSSTTLSTTTTPAPTITTSTPAPTPAPAPTPIPPPPAVTRDIKACSKVAPRLDSWSPDEVAEYILSKGFAQEAESFKTQSVDGISLLLMQRTDFTYGLKIKLGPALKIYDQVCKLKKEYFQSITITQQ